MEGQEEHLRWCRWCDFIANERSRRRHEAKEHSTEKQATSKLAPRRSKSSIPPEGHIWCTSCNVIVQNSVSGVSSHSASTHHTSKSSKPLCVSTSSAPFVALEQASAILPPLKSIYNRSAAKNDAVIASKDDDHGTPRPFSFLPFSLQPFFFCKRYFILI